VTGCSRTRAETQPARLATAKASWQLSWGTLLSIRMFPRRPNAAARWMPSLHHERPRSRPVVHKEE
jgi:hypothetical protein